MIIKISQTASNIKQPYDIEGENFYYSGDAGSISRLQSITLSNKENAIKGIYNISKWVNYIPLRYLFGEANLTRVFQNMPTNITPNGEKHIFPMKTFSVKQVL